MAFFVRAVLWVLLVIAPGGVFLLPLLVGDTVARRRRQDRASNPGVPSGEAASPPLATAAPGR